MNHQQVVDPYSRKAQESLATADSEFANRRYNSCANRCYYACFQAAISALLAVGIGPRDRRGRWEHDYVQAAFAGQLIHRRKLYPSTLGPVLSSVQELRQTADYSPHTVTQKQADRALRRTREFVQVVTEQGGLR